MCLLRERMAMWLFILLVNADSKCVGIVACSLTWSSSIFVGDLSKHLSQTHASKAIADTVQDYECSLHISYRSYAADSSDILTVHIYIYFYADCVPECMCWQAYSAAHGCPLQGLCSGNLQGKCSCCIVVCTTIMLSSRIRFLPPSASWNELSWFEVNNGVSSQQGQVNLSA